MTEKCPNGQEYNGIKCVPKVKEYWMRLSSGYSTSHGFESSKEFLKQEYGYPIFTDMGESLPEVVMNVPTKNLKSGLYLLRVSGDDVEIFMKVEDKKE